MEILCNSSKNVLIVRLIVITIMCQGTAIPMFIWSKEQDIISLAWIIEIAYAISALLSILNMFRRCPVCGRWTLSRTEAYRGDRYTTYYADCRNCGHDFLVERDRWERKTSYSIYDDNYRWPQPITPIWEKNEKK